MLLLRQHLYFCTSKVSKMVQEKFFFFFLYRKVSTRCGRPLALPPGVGAQTSVAFGFGFATLGFGITLAWVA